MWWRLKSPASRLFTQPSTQAQIKENIKAPRHWPLWGEFTGDRWMFRTKGSSAENACIWWRHHVSIRLHYPRIHLSFIPLFVVLGIRNENTEPIYPVAASVAQGQHSHERNITISISYYRYQSYTSFSNSGEIDVDTSVPLDLLYEYFGIFEK